jgi:hypothetical protein
MLVAMLALFHLLLVLISNRFKSRRRLEIENLYLRHQLNIAVRRSPHRLRLRMAERALLVWMIWLLPNLLNLSCVVRPETILRRHRAGFRAYWALQVSRSTGAPQGQSRAARRHPADERGEPPVGCSAHSWGIT